MISFKQYLKEYLDYIEWGFVLPNGKIVYGKDSDVTKHYNNENWDGHENLSKRSGFKDYNDAIDSGCIRWYIGKFDMGLAADFRDIKTTEIKKEVILNMINFINVIKNDIKDKLILFELNRKNSNTPIEKTFKTYGQFTNSMYDLLDDVKSEKY